MRVSISLIEENDKKTWRVTACDGSSEKIVYECDEVRVDGFALNEIIELYKSLELDYVVEIKPEEFEKVSHDHDTYTYKAKRVRVNTLPYLVAENFAYMFYDQPYWFRVRVAK